MSLNVKIGGFTILWLEILLWGTVDSFEPSLSPKLFDLAYLRLVSSLGQPILKYIG